MDKPKPGADVTGPSQAEVAAAVEAIGRLHHTFGSITGSLAMARNAARVLLSHTHALPGGVSRDAAVAFAKLRLEVAHGEALTVETLRSVVETVSVPEVRLTTAATSAGGKTPSRSSE